VSIPSYFILFAIGIPDEFQGFASYAASMGLAGAVIVNQTLAEGAVMYGVVQDLRGRTFSVVDSLQFFLRRLLPLLGVVICTLAAFTVGLVALVVPAIILICQLYVSMPVCIAEHAGVFASMSRSRALTEGHRMQVFGAFMLVAAATGVIEWIAAQTPAGATGTQIGIQAAMVIVNSFDGVLTAVLYYELRAAREGVDIEKIASVFA
jgi:hypothetical protein